MGNKAVKVLTAIGFVLAFAGLVFWLPYVLRHIGEWGPLTIGAVPTLVTLFAAPLATACAIWSAKRDERRTAMKVSLACTAFIGVIFLIEISGNTLSNAFGKPFAIGITSLLKGWSVLDSAIFLLPLLTLDFIYCLITGILSHSFKEKSMDTPLGVFVLKMVLIMLVAIVAGTVVNVYMESTREVRSDDSHLAEGADYLSKHPEAKEILAQRGLDDNAYGDAYDDSENALPTLISKPHAPHVMWDCKMDGSGHMVGYPPSISGLKFCDPGSTYWHQHSHNQVIIVRYIDDTLIENLDWDELEQLASLEPGYHGSEDVEPYLTDID